MGFALTIIYIVVTIISPEQFGKEWASYHVVMYLAAITASGFLAKHGDIQLLEDFHPNVFADRFHCRDCTFAGGSRMAWRA